MKIKNLVLSLTLAGLCFHQASAQGIPTPASSRHIGDATTQDVRPPAFHAARSVSDAGVDFASALNREMLAPTAASYASHELDSSGYSLGSVCGSDCGGCVSCGGAAGLWITGESLLWFSDKLASPALVTTSDPGTLPLAGRPGVTSQLGGGDGIDFGLLPGYRVSGGFYLDPDQKIGIGSRGYGIFAASERYRNASDGTGGANNPSIGIPFFDLRPGNATNYVGDNAFLVAYENNLGQPVSSGAVDVRSDLEMFGGDGSLHLLLSRSAGIRMDMLGGYSYNELRNSISVASQSTNLFTGDAIVDGTQFQTNDLFATKNVFHGGHLGVLSSVVRNRVSLSTLAKISFGSMQQSGAISGFTVQTPPVGAASTFGAGILTQPSNIGTFSRNRFAYIPELGIKLGLRPRDNIEFNVGYTMMMWSSVVMAGDQIDNVVDARQLAGTNVSNRPALPFRETAFWMQGVDLGVTLTY